MEEGAAVPSTKRSWSFKFPSTFEMPVVSSQFREQRVRGEAENTRDSVECLGHIFDAALAAQWH